MFKPLSQWTSPALSGLDFPKQSNPAPRPSPFPSFVASHLSPNWLSPLPSGPALPKLSNQSQDGQPLTQWSLPLTSALDPPQWFCPFPSLLSFPRSLAPPQVI